MICFFFLDFCLVKMLWNLVLFVCPSFCLVKTLEDLCVPFHQVLFSRNAVELGDIFAWLNSLFSKNALERALFYTYSIKLYAFMQFKITFFTRIHAHMLFL
jgi:hypothetical protein